ncbi:hypothetical protein B4102_0258 [Heyndrickxia sporothermodurans]|uniref:Uncharacterized protein n=1 Tax=Heyndrickxia sporothermodurans TaxID=46224 RepID=A0A150KTJ0_9BACI|nr:hypothetical protein B4102_0258 [Heyndrickxia sporothermodurans]
MSFLLELLDAQSGLERKALDSCGICWTDETPQERSDEEAHRQPRGKQVPEAERNGHLFISNAFLQNSGNDVRYIHWQSSFLDPPIIL